MIMTAVDLINYHALDELREIDDDGSLIADLLQTFFQDADRTMSTMTLALNQGNLTELGRLAHRMKSGAANIGASRVSWRCRRIEEAACHGQPLNFQEELTFLLQDVEETRSASGG